MFISAMGQIRPNEQIFAITIDGNPVLKRIAAPDIRKSFKIQRKVGNVLAPETARQGADAGMKVQYSCLS